MKIYNGLGLKVLEVEVDDNSYRQRTIMGAHNITLHYALAEHVELPVGAWCEYEGERFTLLRPQNFKMKHSRYFEYTVTLEAPEGQATAWKFLNTVDGRLKFSLTATPLEHLQMFVDNMNRRDTGWAVGECIKDTERVINYDHDYLYDALKKIATEFKTEFEFNGKTVSLRKVEYNKSAPLSLSYGRGNGFKPGVGRSNTKDTPPVEILYTQGGTDNLDPSKYGGRELHMPVSAQISYDGEHFDTEDSFNPERGRLYATDAQGLSVRRYDKQLKSLAEDSVDLSNIYPKREGAVTSVNAVDQSKNFYDIIDTTIPESLDYEECLIKGETLKMAFQTGMLAGREFDVKYYHRERTLNGKRYEARRFEIVPQEIDGETMPNATFCPQVTDKYIVFNCQLPDAYICDNKTKTGAEWDMFRAAVKYLFDNEEEKFTFKGELDGIWAKKDWLNISGRIKLGGFILFTDNRFQPDGVLVRITGIKDYINNPHSPTIELSNETVTSGVASTLKTLEAQEVLIEDNHREALQFTKRRFRDARETISMLGEALLENFSNAINPVAVQTMSMLVGDEALQFRFVNSKTNPVSVSHTITWDNTSKTLNVPSGIIQHMTLGVASLSSQHNPSEYKYWDLAQYISGRIEDGRAKYYLYAQVSRTSQTGYFIITEHALRLEEVSGFYMLLVGVLNSEYEGERSFVTLYGFTEVLPGRVTTDRVVSGDGSSFFDMVANSFKLGDRLSFNTNGDGLLKIKGTLVQNEGGNEGVLGVYRGVYNASYTYYNGDEVIYTLNNLTSTYRCVSQTPIRNIPPTNAVSWAVVAAGSKGEDGKKGEDGTSVKILGSKASQADLPKTGNTEGDGYLINGELWVWDGSRWNNVGSIKGDKGDKGNPGSPGAPGADAPFFELRYAVNGSTTSAPSLTTTAVNPTGWSTTQPSVSTGKYLWMTIAKKTADGKSLLQNWSTPVRITPYDGTDGKQGKSPVMVYRGNYLSTQTYYGNENRLDCVKSGDTYYIARIDSGTFKNVAPPDTNKWNSFGASFESVATNLLLAENANIGDWFMSKGKIVSTLNTGDIIELDAKNNLIKVSSSRSGGSYSSETTHGSVIELDAYNGIVETRAKDNWGVSYMSPSGVFANRAGTNCVPSSSGMTVRAAIAALGYGSLNKDPYMPETNLVCGLYGTASNTGTAPHYGAYLNIARMNGLVLNTRYISSTNVYLTDNDTFVMGLSKSGGNGQMKVYLPTASREGQTLFFKQWSGSGNYMRLYPRSGQKIFDDNTENEYYDVDCGWELVAHFVRAQLNGESVQVWHVSRFKF